VITIQQRTLQRLYGREPGRVSPFCRGWKSVPEKKCTWWRVVADENDQVLGENPRLLIGATRLSLLDIVKKTHNLDGICISSHVDRPSYSLIGQLGFIPEDLHLDAVEVSYRVPLEKALTLCDVFRCAFFTRHWKSVDGIYFSCPHPGRNPIGLDRCKWA
jgi:hypothetical protein